MTTQRRVAILGLGYVGLPLALAASEAGHQVIGFDVNERRVNALSEGSSGIEDVDDLELKLAAASGRLRFTATPTELADRNIYVICVPTPLTDKVPDLSMVRDAVDMVGASLAAGDLVILESTTYPGTTEELVAPRIAEASGLEAGRDYHLAFSPERIDPGNSTFGLRNTTKVVGGLGDAATREAALFYGSFIEQVHTVSSPREAEMAKLLENTYRHVNIALVNEMAIFCTELGIDLWEAIEAASTKPFGFMKFQPGPGVGGHCIPIDPSYLSWRVRRLGYSFRFVELAAEINDRMPDYIATRVSDLLNQYHKPVNGARVLLLGVAYKRDVGDVRESPAYTLARRLRVRGAQVTWHDPHVKHFEAEGIPFPRTDRLTEAELGAADLVIVHTDHSYYDWPAIIAGAHLVFDTRNATIGLEDPKITRL